MSDNETQMSEGQKKPHWAIRLYHWSNTWTGTVVIVLLVIFFVAQAFVIPSGSMKNTLLVGDHLFVKKYVYGIPIPHIPWLEIPVLPDFDGDGHIVKGPGPKRGDIVIFRYPRDTKVHFVKRCVGEPGDILFVVHKRLYLHPHEGNDYVKKHYAGYTIAEIDGRLFVKDPFRKEFPGIHNDPHVTMDGMAPIQVFEFGPVRVPENNWFMMGDNRDHSNDSRFWGTVPYKLIVGKPWFIYFSWDTDPDTRDPKKRYKIRWDRIGRDVETLEREKPRYVE